MLNFVLNKIDIFFKKDTSENLLWLIFDKFFRLGLGLFVGISVTKYLGPELFGQWNYVIAFVSLVSVLSTLGLDQILIKELLDTKNNDYELLGTVFYLRLIGSTLCFIIVFIYFKIFKNNIYLLLVSVFSVLSLVFQSFDVIDIKNQSLLHSKKTVIAKNFSFAIVSIFKLVLIYFKFSFLYFVFLSFFEVVIGSVGMLINYGFYEFKKWRFETSLIAVLLKQAWPLILSSIIIMMYMRIDQIMIADLIGNKQLGFYSISTKFTELWYFIPSVFVSTFYPKLIKERFSNNVSYYSMCLKLFKLLFFVSFSISLFFIFFSNEIIKLLYGEEYLEASEALKISISTGIFVFWGVASGNMLVIENLNVHNLIKSILGLLLNISLNIFLIPKYGIQGAAFATLASQFFASSLYFIFFKNTRHIFLLQCRSIIFFPIS